MCLHARLVAFLEYPLLKLQYVSCARGDSILIQNTFVNARLRAALGPAPAIQRLLVRALAFLIETIRFIDKISDREAFGAAIFYEEGLIDVEVRHYRRLLGSYNWTDFQRIEVQILVFLLLLCYAQGSQARSSVPLAGAVD